MISSNQSLAGLPNDQLVIYGDDTSQYLYPCFFPGDKIPVDSASGFIDRKNTFCLHVKNLENNPARLMEAVNNDRVLDIAILCIDTNKQGCMSRFNQYYQDIQNYFGTKNGIIFVYCNNFQTNKDYTEFSMTAFWERNNLDDIIYFCEKNKISCFKWEESQYKVPQGRLLSSLYELIRAYHERDSNRRRLCTNIDTISVNQVIHSIESAKQVYADKYYGIMSTWYLEKNRGIPEKRELEQAGTIESCFRLLLKIMQGGGGDTTRSFKYFVLSAIFPELENNVQNDLESREAISLFLASLKASNYILSPLKLACFSLWAKANNNIPTDIINVISEKYITLYQNEKSTSLTKK